MVEIHIPAEINFECTGCGNCCLEWPVPLLAYDVDKIAALSREMDEPLPENWAVPLTTSQPKLKNFTHTLEKRADGKCWFLSAENRCRLHERFGAQAKPSMCRLFPYTFNPTPAGVYAALSFASTGVLRNAGVSLRNQAALLQEKWELFADLFGDLPVDWPQIQLADGVPISWDEYFVLDSELLGIITDASPDGIEKRLERCSRHLCRQLPAGAKLPLEPKLEARPKVVDQLLLSYMRKLYLPENVFANRQLDLDTPQLMQDLVHPPQNIQFQFGQRSFSMADINKLSLAQLEPEAENLLFRFVYGRIFAKLYFGYGFADLSVLVGLHHLIMVIALLRIELKVFLLSTGCSGKSQFEYLLELVRTMERRLTQVSFSATTKTCLEVLLTNPQRVQRIISLAG